MAIQANLATTSIGIPVNNAYLRITEIGIYYAGHDKPHATYCMVDCYGSNPNETTIKPFEMRRFNITTADIDPVEGLAVLEKYYKYLMSLPELNGSTMV